MGATVYDLGKDFYNKQEAAILAQYAQELKILDAELNGKYAACISRLRENMTIYIGLLDKAFSPNAAMAFPALLSWRQALTYRKAKFCTRVRRSTVSS